MRLQIANTIVFVRMIVTVHMAIATFLQRDAQCVGTSPFIVQAIVLNFHTSEGVYVETMALLLIDDTETGASGGIIGIPGAPTGRHFLVDEGDAHLLVLEAIVAISRCINARIRGGGNGSFRRR